MPPPPVISSEPLPATAPEVSVAIVGAGACGLSAALFLRDAGVDCLLLERDAAPRGSSALSSGFIPAAGTAVQRAAGISNDDAGRFAADIQAKARGTAAAHLVAAYSAASGWALDALQQRHGLAFELLDDFRYPGHSASRMHTLAQRSGVALVAALERAALAAGADLLCQARVSTLHADAQGCIQGLAFARPDGRLEHLRCRALLLACNGFGGHPALVAELLPQMRGAPFAGHAGNDGSAIGWGRQLGAGLADLGGYQGHGSWTVPQGVLMTWGVMMQGGVQINARGERFHDETAGYSEAAVQVLAQPAAIAFNVFDDALRALARGFPEFVQAEAAGAVRSAAGAEDLAAIIGCPTSNLRHTLQDLARHTTTPDRFGRRFARALHWPLHAVKVTGALFHTQGGLEIDAHCRVLRADGRGRLPNLWAAGGAARGVSGNAVWGYLSGNGLLSAVAGGALAAASLASYLAR